MITHSTIISRLISLSLPLLLISCGQSISPGTGSTPLSPPGGVDMNDIMNIPSCQDRTNLQSSDQCIIDRAVSKNTIILCEGIGNKSKQILCRDAVIVNNAKSKKDCQITSDKDIRKDCEKLIQ